MKYRREIDGLRAVAVVAVIAFHAGVEVFRGGYIGVDIFFVISGYLIAAQVVDELAGGRFSLFNFYLRRAKRILPAMYFVMLICIPFAWFFLLPNYMRDFSASTIAATIFLSNILFWRESGYFDGVSELKPFLHTWSLAIEGQFYLLFPFLIMLTPRIYWRWTLVIILGIASLLLAQWASIVKPTAAFYLLPTRGWEFLIGVISAFYLSKNIYSETHKILSGVGSWVGMILIVIALLTFSKSTPIPGLYTILPTLGAALIIVFASPNTIIGNLLGNQIFVSLGLLSYSAYLWHYPIFSFARHLSLDAPSKPIFFLLGLLSFIAAFFTWKYIEVPFREKILLNGRLMTGVFALCASVLILIGFSGYLSNGFIANSRWDKIRGAQETMNERASGFKFCSKHEIKSELSQYMVCLIGDTTVEPEGVLWGDSFAGSLLFGLNVELEKRGKSFYAVLSDGCIPVVGVSRKSSRFQCSDQRHRIFIEKFMDASNLRKLVWIGSFDSLTGPDLDPDYVLDYQVLSQGNVKSRIIQTANALKGAGKEVVIVVNIPSFPQPVAEFASKIMLLDSDSNSAIQKVRKIDVVIGSGMNEQFLGLLSKDAIVVDGQEVFCEKSNCFSHDSGGGLLFVDSGHISHLASIKLARHILFSFYKN